MLRTGFGQALVEIRDAESGRPCPGYGFDKATAVTENAVNASVRWGETSEVGELAGRAVVLAFRLRDSKLFAFRFV